MSTPPKLELRYSDVYRKRMNLPVGFYPISTPFTVSTTAAAKPVSPSRLLGSPFAGGSSSLTLSPLGHGRDQSPHSRSTTSLSTSVSAFDENEELWFNSLVDLRWAKFENLGFEDDGAVLKEVGLDLNESARKVSGDEVLSFGDVMLFRLFLHKGKRSPGLTFRRLDSLVIP